MDLSQDEGEARKLFAMMDVDGSGSISFSELNHHLRIGDLAVARLSERDKILRGVPPSGLMAVWPSTLTPLPLLTSKVASNR